MSVLSNALYKARKARADKSKFKALIAAPVTGAVTFPANARVALRSNAGAVAGTTAATVAGPSARTIKTPTMQAGEAMRLDMVERGSVVTPAAGFDVLVHIGLGGYAKIGGA